ncbi:cephalotoxin-like protein [Engraulis encrasicolus]|uniref:cephalotoxin-like protein n=1 Tax=Engraulis encrasicolus TaxID=184585 RepID=UPI002FD5F0EC
MQGLSKFANAVPFIGPAFAVINMVMLFVPQHDPVLKAVTDGFREVNRKLDSLSLQVSNLATDVEWYNYASVYSQDEVRILSAWNKYEEFFRDHNLNEMNYLAKVFVNYYEYSQVESSMDSLYHYLTVEGTALSGNLNNLLRRKFKCDLKKILNYNLYFNSLLMKGIALNNFYWNLIGYKTTDKLEEDKKMFKKVFAAQSRVVDSCLENHMDYVKEDVVETAKLVSYDNLQGIADKVKGFLDDKYDFYKWVVLAYKSSKETGSFKYLVVYDTMTKIPIGDDLTVAIAYTQKADIPEEELKNLKMALRCILGACAACSMRNEDLLTHVLDYEFTMNVVEYAKRTHAIYDKNDFAENPSPNVTEECGIGAYPYKTAIYYSRTLSPCDGPDTKCQNDGTCKRLLDSSDAVCVCQDGFYGETCETKVDTEILLDVLKLPLSTVTPSGVRLADIESKLNEILAKIQ